MSEPLSAAEARAAKAYLEHAAISIPPPHGPFGLAIFLVYELTEPPPSHAIQSFRGSPAISRS
eukprot:COSAG03_NODE_506_length_7355_cov_2.657764_11_plen_62_part_01